MAKPEPERLSLLTGQISSKGGQAMTMAIATPDNDNGNHQGHCSHCGKVWTLNERQGVCQWCDKPASCITATSKPRQFKSRSNGYKRQADIKGKLQPTITAMTSYKVNG